MWDGCNSEVSKAIRPSFKDYEENQRNETAIKFGALNPALNKPGEKYTTHHKIKLNHPLKKLEQYILGPKYATFNH